MEAQRSEPRRSQILGRTTKITKITKISLFFVVLVFVVPVFVVRAAGTSARTGTIRGRVELRRVPAPVERRPSVSELGAPAGGASRDLQERARAVVYLESAPRGAF